MRNPFEILVLALALSLTPACATLRLDNPVAAARTLDQRAYALLNTYAATVEEATDIIRDPATPLVFIRALGAAERAATPAAEALEIAVAAYLQANARLQNASGANQSDIEGAAGARVEAARELGEAVAAAEAPIAALESLVEARAD